MSGMHGRIFRVNDLVHEDHNQSELVRSKGFWESAEYFQGTPTYEVIPGIPPYHFGCRTRLVPYTDADADESFDSMAADHPLYASILKDKLQNYEIGPDNLPAVRDYAGGCEWKEGSLEYHYLKHGGGFGFSTADDYESAAWELMKSQSATICLQYEYDKLIMYVYDSVDGSKSGSYQVLVLDLDELKIKTFSRKRKKQLAGTLNTDAGHIAKQNIINAVKKGHMTEDEKRTPLAQALLEYEELAPIAMYRDAIRMIRENDIDEIYLEAYSCYDYRTDLLQVLIEAGKLSEAELEEIRQVDRFILENEVHFLFIPLKEWLISLRK